MRQSTARAPSFNGGVGTCCAHDPSPDPAAGVHRRDLDPGPRPSPAALAYPEAEGDHPGGCIVTAEPGSVPVGGDFTVEGNFGGASIFVLPGADATPDFNVEPDRLRRWVTRSVSRSPRPAALATSPWSGSSRVPNAATPITSPSRAPSRTRRPRPGPYGLPTIVDLLIAMAVAIGRAEFQPRRA